MENTPTPGATTPSNAAPKKNISRIGKYTVVDLKELENIRDLWKNEAQDFTTWMSQQTVMDQLGEVLNFNKEIRDIQTECKGGKSGRRCDIVARLHSEDDDDEAQDEVIAIENQLEKTDFDHLGRVILYAALNNATRLVWVVKNADYDCRKAIAWLNKNTTDSLRFYLVEVAVYDMSGSDKKENCVAPIFRLIEGPDEEEKVQESGTPKRKANLAFWKGFLAFKNEVGCEKLDCITSFRQPLPENWYGIAIGSSKCHINLEYSKCQAKIVIVTEGRENASFKKLKEKLDEMREAIGGVCDDFTRDEKTKQPLFRFFGPKCDIQKEEKNGVLEAYAWLVNGLSKIVPIVKDTLNLR